MGQGFMTGLSVVCVMSTPNRKNKSKCSKLRASLCYESTEDVQGDWSEVKNIETGTSWGRSDKQGLLWSMEQNLDFILCIVRSYQNVLSRKVICIFKKVPQVFVWKLVCKETKVYTRDQFKTRGHSPTPECTLPKMEPLLGVLIFIYFRILLLKPSPSLLTQPPLTSPRTNFHLCKHWYSLNCF